MTNTLKIPVNDYNPKRVKGLRSAAKCECRICEVAKMPGITYQRMMKKKHGIPKKKDAVAPPKSYKVCSNCFAYINRGSNHTAITCKYSHRCKVHNIEALVQNLTTLQRATSRVIKDTDGTFLATLGRGFGKKRNFFKQTFVQNPTRFKS